MNIIFGILAIVAAILLILIVVVQNSKGGGLSNALGASNITNMIGTRRATQDIEKFTWYLVAAMMVMAFMANVTGNGRTVKTADSFESMLNAPSAPAAAPAPEGGATEAPAEGE
jgi:preprotein translocase subunit SecG